MGRICSFIFMFTFFIIPTSISLADVVELKTGQRVEGTFKQATPAGVVIEVGGQTITFEQEKVRAIYFGTAPAGMLQPSSAQEALRALKALQSVVRGGVGYRDYAPRVSDAKIVVDRYLEEPDRGDVLARKSVHLAMGYFELASTAWNSRLVTSRDRTTDLGRAVIEYAGGGECSKIQELMEEAKRIAKIDRLDPLDVGIVAEYRGPQVFWSCASDKIAEAERLLGGSK